MDCLFGYVSPQSKLQDIIQYGFSVHRVCSLQNCSNGLHVTCRLRATRDRHYMTLSKPEIYSLLLPLEPTSTSASHRPDMMSALSNLWTMHKMLSRDAQFSRHVVSLRRPRCPTAYDLVLGQRRSPSSVVDLGVLVVGGRVRKSAERCSRAISAIRSPSSRTNRPRTNTKNTQIEGKGCTSSSVS